MPSPRLRQPGDGTATSRCKPDNLPRGQLQRLLTLPFGWQVQAMAIGGPDLYLITDYGSQPYILSAYDRATGRIIRRVELPSSPVMAVGPDGSVWLTFSSSDPCRAWLLSADLSRKSATDITCAAIQPIGSDRALAIANHEVVLLEMPPPGRPGRATLAFSRAIHRPVIGNWAVASLTPIGGNIAALLANDFGDWHVAIAGQPGLSFGGGPRQQVRYVLAQGGGLWVTTATSTGPDYGPLVRLSATLKPITPASIQANPIFSKSTQVWADRSTVLVTTAVPHRGLVCFAYRGAAGPVETVLARQPTVLTASGGTLYLARQTGNVGLTTQIITYRLPADCR